MDTAELKTFDDLVKWATWSVISSITSGAPLKSAIWQVCDVAIRWHLAQKETAK